MAGSSAKKNSGQRPQGQNGDRKPPVHECRYRTLRISIWLNSGSNGDYYSLTANRGYKKEDGTWATANSTGRDDCLPMAQLYTQAWEWMQDNPPPRGAQEQSDTNGSGSDEQPPY